MPIAAPSSQAPAQRSASAVPRLSVTVITHNEAGRLATCLASVGFADELIVVDSGSTDGTADLARRLGARVIVTPDWPGFGAQKQRALAAATGHWVLSLDADEWIDDALAAAIRGVLAATGAAGPASRQPAGYQINRMSAFCGQWMRAGSWHPDLGVRLFQRHRARFSDDLVHERLLLDGPAGRLPGLLLHNSITTLHDGIDKMNRYSSGRAADLHARGRRGGLARAIGHGSWAFVRAYLLRRGFLDGRLGFVLATLDAQASYTRYLKLGLLQTPVPHALQHPNQR